MPQHLTREYAAGGMSLVALMQVVFLIGADRGPVYLMLVVVGLVAALMAAGGLAFMDRRDGLIALSAGFAIGAFARLGFIVTDLSRLPLWLNIGFVAGGALVAIAAGLWAAAPEHDPEGRARLIRLGCYLLGGAYFISAGRALGGGRITSLVGLALGSVGYLLVAAMVTAPQPPKPARE